MASKQLKQKIFKEKLERVADELIDKFLKEFDEKIKEISKDLNKAGDFKEEDDGMMYILPYNGDGNIIKNNKKKEVVGNTKNEPIKLTKKSQIKSYTPFEWIDGYVYNPDGKLTRKKILDEMSYLEYRDK